MKREIVLKLAIPRRPRSRWTLACVAVALGSGAVVYATVPNTFNAGDLLSAEKLNDNFGALVDRSTDQTIDGVKTFSKSALFSGDVGIGTATPGRSLHVSGSNGGTEANLIRLESTAAVPRQWDINIKSGKLILGDNTAVADRLTLDLDGNVGIGTTAPTYPLDVLGTQGNGAQQGALRVANGAPDTGIRILNKTTNGHEYVLYSSGTGSGLGAGSFSIYDVPAQLPRITVTASGRVGVSQQSPSYALDVGGDINASGNVRAAGAVLTSDARLKRNVRRIENALDDVGRLRGVRFVWKGDGKPSVGVIAQEVEKVFPEIVFAGADGIKGVDYPKLAAVLIESTKELRADNEALRARVERLEARLDPRASR